jgi:predicted house-cleaning noncanonical NTP pyrophosphatase (MazG superfamily)
VCAQSFYNLVRDTIPEVIEQLQDECHQRIVRHGALVRE